LLISPRIADFVSRFFLEAFGFVVLGALSDFSDLTDLSDFSDFF
jgi:hypothetical protein